MKKLMIKGLGSEDYPKGRIDSFEIELPKEAPPEQLILLLRELKFPDGETEKLDILLPEIDYLFLYGNPKIKAHISVGEDTFTLRFDTSIKRDNLNRIVGKYFDFPK